MAEEKSNDRELGELSARMDNVEFDLHSLKKDTKAMLAIMNQTKGGWKTILAVGVAAGGVGAFLAKFFPFIISK